MFTFKQDVVFLEQQSAILLSIALNVYMAYELICPHINIPGYMNGLHSVSVIGFSREIIVGQPQYHVLYEQRGFPYCQFIV